VFVGGIQIDFDGDKKVPQYCFVLDVPTIIWRLVITEIPSVMQRSAINYPRQDPILLVAVCDQLSKPGALLIFIEIICALIRA
jgi:hypothetical protein